MVEHGAALTSRQIAEAAGVAEGTVFRVFGDKETLLREAAETYLDPGPVRERLRAIDASLPLEDKVLRVLTILQERFRGVISIMSAIGHRGTEAPHLRHPEPHRRWEYASIVAKAVEPELGRLNLPPEDVAPYIRLIAFATSIPQFAAEKGFDARELARLIVHGIAGDAAAAREDATRGRAGRAVASRRASWAEPGARAGEQGRGGAPEAAARAGRPGDRPVEKAGERARVVEEAVVEETVGTHA